MSQRSRRSYLVLLPLALSMACENKGDQLADGSNKVTKSSTVDQESSSIDPQVQSFDFNTLQFAYLSTNYVSYKEAGQASGEVLILSSDANFCVHNDQAALARGAHNLQILSPNFVESVSKFGIADANNNTRAYVAQETNINFQSKCIQDNYVGYRAGKATYTVNANDAKQVVIAQVSVGSSEREFDLPLVRCAGRVSLTLPLKNPGGSEGPFYPNCAATDLPAGSSPHGSGDGNDKSGIAAPGCE